MAVNIQVMLHQLAQFSWPDNHVLYDAHYAPKWVKVSPFVAMLIGFVMAMRFYIWNRNAKTLGRCTASLVFVPVEQMVF